MHFKDKAVIVTGGGGKIGKAYAMAFAKEGAKVSLPDIARGASGAGVRSVIVGSSGSRRNRVGRGELEACLPSLEWLCLLAYAQ